jgi:hypothetical protein
MAASKWFPQQLVAFLEAVWSATTEAEAGRMAVERGAVPVRELTSITAGGRHHELTVPDVGGVPDGHRIA